ncbi:MAG: hypothetical protein A2170_14565 [Deltaproteobacteria bacterium RBG_13_53_10]|nr:MAG: hypothetical protein A2170_14565 [Deltaproteobacteria bacterium RBG_13_53_10]
MPLPEYIHDKALRIERVINFPKIPSPGRQPWENLPMSPYSDLPGAVASIVEKGRKVAIITGFYVPGGEPPATETDGPPGALILGEGLKSLGMEVVLITDQYTLPTLFDQRCSLSAFASRPTLS